MGHTTTDLLIDVLTDQRRQHRAGQLRDASAELLGRTAAAVTARDRP